MLILSRKSGQSIKLRSGGVEVEVTVIRIEGNRVQVGLAAPDCVKILRSELIPNLTADNLPISISAQSRRAATRA